MDKRFVLFRGHRFLGGRAVAYEVRREAEKLLEKQPNLVIVLDFEGVEGVSHSFADELLSPLSDLLGERVAERVRIENVDPDVLEDLRLVAMMHGLHMPSVASRRPAAACN